MQFLIILLGSDPLVWRRIIVPTNYTFWDLHVAIQDVMGWADTHLHQFTFAHSDSRRATSAEVQIGVPDFESGDKTVQPGWEAAVADFVNWSPKTMEYLYDFGDDWSHMIAFETIADNACAKPICTGGSGACPPEDVGGILGYERFLSIIRKKTHPERAQLFDWYCGIQEWKLRDGEALIKDQMNVGSYDPAYFDPVNVVFDDPAKRFRKAFNASG